MQWNLLKHLFSHPKAYFIIFIAISQPALSNTYLALGNERSDLTGNLQQYWM
jgi:hypothetical protein